MNKEMRVSCSFNVEDVLAVRPDIEDLDRPIEMAELFLTQNGKYIIEAMSSAGFDAIENLWLEDTK